MSCFQEVIWRFWPLEKLWENKGALRQAKKTNVYSHLQGPLVAATFAAVRIVVVESLGVFEDLAASAATRTSE